MRHKNMSSDKLRICQVTVYDKFDFDSHFICNCSWIMKGWSFSLEIKNKYSFELKSKSMHLSHFMRYVNGD